MKKRISGLIIFMSFLTLLAGCGYYFPHVYEGPHTTIYLPQWKNRTSKLDLDAKLYRALSGWFQNATSITTTKNKQGADLVLAGEITSIDLPSVSWSGNASARTVKITLYVRYILKDLKTGAILWEVPSERWTEDYDTSEDSATTHDNEKKALQQIVKDLSENIYLGTLNKLRKINTEKKGASS